MSERIESSGVDTSGVPCPLPTSEPSPALERGIEQLNEAIEKVMRKSFSRRALYGFIGAVAAGYTINKVEKAVMDLHWGNDGSEIVPAYNLDDITRPAKNAGLASSGFDGTHGPLIVSELEKHVYGKDFANSYIEFGTTFDIRAMGRKAIAYRDLLQPRKLDLHGVSEGLLISLMTAQAANVPLRMVAGNDAPFNADDVKHKKILKAFAALRDLGLYRGGMIGETAIFFGQEIEQYGTSHVWESATTAMHDMWHGLKPTFTDGQADFLAHVDLWKDRRLFRNVITHETHFVLLETEHASTDPVIKDVQAAERWNSWATSFGAKVKPIDTPMEGHAHISAGIRTGAPYMRSIIADY